MIPVLSQLQFVRPQWLWALAALPMLAAWWHWQRRRAGVWREHVDPHLLPHLVEPAASRAGVGGLALRLLAFALAVLALAGPGWRQDELALRQQAPALVVALDLSGAMLAPDLPPSRLLQARAWLGRLLEGRDGEVGLLAFADDAFTVAPLTDDAANVAIFLDALAPDVMPVDGHRPDRAIHAAMALLAQAGQPHGDILLMTHAADAATVAAAARAHTAGFRVSVLGLGRPAGASYRAADGRLQPSRLDAGSLQRVAAAGGGRYAALSSATAAPAALLRGLSADGGGAPAAAAGTRVWRDGGYWLLPALALLVLLAFRRGVALMALGVCLLMPPGAHAGGPPAGTVWRRPDQVEHVRMREGLEAYRAGNHDQAERVWRDLGSADAAYNRGNALARTGRLQEALEAYDQALRRQPGMEDAVANRAVVEAALRRQPPPDDGGAHQRPQDGEQGEGAGQAGDQDAAPDNSGDAAGEPASPPARPEAGHDPAPAPQDPQPEQGDADRQREADAAQRERIERALEDEARARDREPEPPAGDKARAGESDAEREQREAAEAWLRRVPDDPGGLLRARFQLEHQRRSGAGGRR